MILFCLHELGYLRLNLYEREASSLELSVCWCSVGRAIRSTMGQLGALWGSNGVQPVLRVVGQWCGVHPVGSQVLGPPVI